MLVNHDKGRVLDLGLIIKRTIVPSDLAEKPEIDRAVELAEEFDICQAISGLGEE